MKELSQNAALLKAYEVRIKKVRFCDMCGIEYKPAQGRQKYCGSYLRKEGCS